MTKQTIEIGTPDEGGQLLFYIECPDCNTLRGFRVGNTWGALTEGKGRGIQWDTECEKCKRQFRAKLVWGTTEQYWTTKRVAVNGIPFVDACGLMPPKEEE